MTNYKIGYKKIKEEKAKRLLKKEKKNIFFLIISIGVAFIGWIKIIDIFSKPLQKLK